MQTDIKRGSCLPETIRLSSTDHISRPRVDVQSMQSDFSQHLNEGVEVDKSTGNSLRRVFIRPSLSANARPRRCASTLPHRQHIHYGTSFDDTFKEEAATTSEGVRGQFGKTSDAELVLGVGTSVITGTSIIEERTKNMTAVHALPGSRARAILPLGIGEKGRGTGRHSLNFRLSAPDHIHNARLPSHQYHSGYLYRFRRPTPKALTTRRPSLPTALSGARSTYSLFSGAPKGSGSQDHPHKLESVLHPRAHVRRDRAELVLGTLTSSNAQGSGIHRCALRTASEDLRLCDRRGYHIAPLRLM